MKILALSLVLLLSAQSAGAELFELSGTLTCGDPAPGGKLAQNKLSVREMVAIAINVDPETAKRFALVYDGTDLSVAFVARCDGSEQFLLAQSPTYRGTTGVPKDGKMSYAITHILSVSNWTGSLEQGHLTCNLTGKADENTVELLTAKGKCEGSLSLANGGPSYCNLKAKIGKVLKLTNDCPV